MVTIVDGLDADELSEADMDKVKELNGKEVTHPNIDSVGKIMGSSLSGLLHIGVDGRPADRVHFSEFEESDWRIIGDEGPQQVPQIYSCRVCGENLEEKMCYCEDHEPPEDCDKCSSRQINLDESEEEPVWKCEDCNKTFEIMRVKTDD